MKIRDVVGDTQTLLKRADNLAWTSNDGKELMNEIVAKWDSIDTSDMNPFSKLEFCRTILNMTIRAVAWDLESNKRWKNGNSVIAGLNFANFYLLSGRESAAEAKKYKLRQAEDERLLEDLRSALYKY